MRTETPDRFAPVFRTVLEQAWSSLPERIAGMTDDEYRWEPAPGCWTVRSVAGQWLADWIDPEPEPAPVTTIAWRCWHIAVDCLDSYSARMFGRRGTELAGEQWVGTWPEAWIMLERAWEVFRSGAESWSDDELLLPLGPMWGPYKHHARADLVGHAAREVVHHGAEIALLRDLYRTRV